MQNRFFATAFVQDKSSDTADVALLKAHFN